MTLNALTKSCKICSSPSEFAFQADLLKKYIVSYFRCPNCEFLQTEDPHWLDEAYSEAISKLDIGLLWRADKGARIVEGVIGAFFDPNAKFVDWGAGYGVLVRTMRDRGFDFYWRDPYAKNIFAKGFEADPATRYEMITCFEVFEHMPDPIREIEEMLTLSDSIFFTTEILPAEHSKQESWWYLGKESGQHISFYSVKTLALIARRLGLNLTTDGGSYHLLSKRPIKATLFRRITKDGKTAKLLRKYYERGRASTSLLNKDFEALLASMREP